MYREPHLQKKSDECAEIWRKWFDVTYKEPDKDKANILRKKWCQCCDTFGEMVSHAVTTNPRYHRKVIIPGK